MNIAVVILIWFNRVKRLSLVTNDPVSDWSTDLLVVTVRLAT